MKYAWKFQWDRESSVSFSERGKEGRQAGAHFIIHELAA
jgi:hypothetical protein